VLNLSEDRDNLAFLLRSEHGGFFGVYRRNAQEALAAAPLKLPLSVDNPCRGIDFFEEDDEQARTLSPPRTIAYSTNPCRNA
jgi:hypothetical protein